MTEDEPTPKPKKKTWLIVLLSIGIPLVCGVICCGGLAIFGWNKFKDIPIATIAAQVILEQLVDQRSQSRQSQCWGLPKLKAAAKEEPEQNVSRPGLRKHFQRLQDQDVTRRV